MVTVNTAGGRVGGYGMGRGEAAVVELTSLDLLSLVLLKNISFKMKRILNTLFAVTVIALNPISLNPPLRRNIFYFIHLL